MKLRLLFIALMIGCFTVSCGNSSKNQQQEEKVQKMTSLEKVFKEAYEKNKSPYDIIHTEIVRNYILNVYSPEFYEILSQNITKDKYNLEKSYDDYGGIYFWKIHFFNNVYVEISYITVNDGMSIYLKINGKEIDSNGKERESLDY